MAHFYNTCSNSITDNVSLTYITLIHRENMDMKRFRISKNDQDTKVFFFTEQHTEHQQQHLFKLLRTFSQSLSYDTVIELKGKTVRSTWLIELIILEG